MNISALYRALDFEYRHPGTMHPVVREQRRPAAASHSCQPDVLEQRRRTAQLRRFLGDDTAAAPAAAALGSGRSEPGSGSGCVGRPRPAAAPSRLSRLADAVRESRRQPNVEGADLDQALAGRHPLHETARRLLQRVKEENELLQLPSGRRAGSSAAPAGRSLASGARRGHIASARVGGDERERRKRMFSMLYQ